MTRRTDCLRRLLEIVLAAPPTIREDLDEPTPEHDARVRELADALGVAAWDVEQAGAERRCADAGIERVS